MDEREVIAGTCAMEKVAATCFCERNFSRHLSHQLVDCHFRAMFVISPRTAYLLWITLDVNVAGPTGGKRMHVLWMLMFLKEYCTQDRFSGICHVTQKSYCRCVDIFLDRVSNLDLVGGSDQID